MWGEVDVARDYCTALSAARVIEKAESDVATLMVANTTDRPLLLLEGQVLEGGWQNRMVARSLIVAPKDELAVGVVCVEAGRWKGDNQHADSHRRATTWVQAGLRAGGDRQSEVWKRVSEYDARYGRNDTSSFVEHANRAADRVSPLVRGLRPFPGQIGVVIAISGHPVSAELFDSPLTLAEQFVAVGGQIGQTATHQVDALAHMGSALSADEIIASNGRSIRRYRHPIPDNHVIDDTGYGDILARINDEINSGRTVYVHCWGGRGRTSTVVGCWLIEQGLDYDATIARLKELRCNIRKSRIPVPEPLSQHEVLRRRAEGKQSTR